VNVNLQNAGEAAKKVAAGEHLAEPGPSTFRKSLTIGALGAAMAKAQLELKNPPKDSVNPHYKSRYADLATVRDVVVPVLAKHGLAVMQLPSEFGGAVALTTLLTHTSGEWVESTVCLRSPKSDPQGVGSALTYLRRYSLQALAGVAAEDDDDGHAAGQRPAAVTREPQQPQPPQVRYADRDNPGLRAKLAQSLAQTTLEARVKQWWVGEVQPAIEAGQLSRADVDFLTGAGRDHKKSLAQPAAK
jgi:hypothetical protein